MDHIGTCEIDACGQMAVQRCAHCGRALCSGHVVEDYNYLPGGQRPYCVECDAERRQLYERIRRQGLRAIAWSGGGALAGSILGYVVGVVVTADSFTHTVTTDVGFVAGLGLALLVALPSIRPHL
jgi:hypothetical protein